MNEDDLATCKILAGLRKFHFQLILHNFQPVLLR